MKTRNRSGWKAFTSSPFTLIVALIILGFLVRAAWNIHGKAALAGKHLDQTESEITKLQASQADLSAKTADLSTEAGIEAELSEKYRAVAPGESVAVIVDPMSPNVTNGTDANAASSSASLKAPTQGWWQSLLRMLGL